MEKTRSHPKTIYFPWRKQRRYGHLRRGHTASHEWICPANSSPEYPTIGHRDAGKVKKYLLNIGESATVKEDTKNHKRMDFTPKTTCPKAVFCVSLEHAHGPLRAFERCNLHGIWESRKEITIE